MTTNSSTDESTLAEKVISVNERGLTYADWVVYNNSTKRTRYSSVPTSDITAETVVVDGRATKKVTDNGNVTLHQRYIYRGYLQIACCDLTRAAHPALWFITWDPTQPIATRPLAIRKDGTWFAYGWDLTKNICEVFGPAGYIRTAYTYSPYGEVMSNGDVEQPIQWSSEHCDAELALVYYNYRHYNPADGRWIGEDPMGVADCYNLYTFVKGATYLTDFRGLFIVGALAGMALDFTLQVISNAASNKPLLDIDYISIIISGVPDSLSAMISFSLHNLCLHTPPYPFFSSRSTCVIFCERMAMADILC